LSVEGIEDEDGDGEIEEGEDEQGVSGEPARALSYAAYFMPQGLKEIDWECWQSQTTIDYMFVESHPCAKDAQGWGTRLCVERRGHWKAPLLLQSLGEEDQG
jgi:hypothetical protein